MSLLDLNFADLRKKMGGLHASHTQTLWRAIHREHATHLAGRADFLPPLQRWVNEGGHRQIELPKVVSEISSEDGQTRKFLLELSDGRQVETVLMRYPGRFTACLSTQAGCAMGCVFCATGQMGFARHLSAGEIVAQVLHHNALLRAAGEHPLRNIVLMGMGEPLHNYDSVMAALDILSDTRGANLGPARISISTVGVVPGIRRMADEDRPYHLAVSLHGATQAERAALVPAARKWPLDLLMDACRYYTNRTGRRIFFEWTLIDGQNDSPDHACRLAKLLADLPAHINLIPLNRTDGFAGLPSCNALRFKAILRESGFPVTVRQRRGIDVNAGCGQLFAADRPAVSSTC